METQPKSEDYTEGSRLITLKAIFDIGVRDTCPDIKIEISEFFDWFFNECDSHRRFYVWDKAIYSTQHDTIFTHWLDENPHWLPKLESRGFLKKRKQEINYTKGFEMVRSGQTYKLIRQGYCAILVNLTTNTSTTPEVVDWKTNALGYEYITESDAKKLGIVGW
uniref:Uncharacterized protein n=1 Tax=viral metagenome TaxID=1070528 RepID=A0A6M3J4S8_9ZZZZ